MDYRQYREDKILRYLDSFRYSFRKFPPSLQIGLTDRCFNKCLMCGHWQRSKFYDSDIDKLIAFLGYAKRLGLESVCYSGGDPFVYSASRLKRLLEWHKKNGVDYGFITAGYFKDSIFDGLIDLLGGAKFIRVSLDAVDSEIYKKIRGGIDFELIKSSLERMLGFNDSMNIFFGITIQKLNQYHLPEIFDFALSLGIREVRCWIVRENKKLLPTCTSEVILLLEKYSRIFDGIGISNNLGDAKRDLVFGEGNGLSFSRCYACLYQFFIDADGEVYPCCITAGDTEARSHCESFGNIFKINYDNSLEVVHHFSTLWSQALIYNKIELASLPSVCKRNCITRLRTVNSFVESAWFRKEFI